MKYQGYYEDWQFSSYFMANLKSSFVVHSKAVLNYYLFIFKVGQRSFTLAYAFKGLPARYKDVKL